VDDDGLGTTTLGVRGARELVVALGRRWRRYGAGRRRRSGGAAAALGRGGGGAQAGRPRGQGGLGQGGGAQAAAALGQGAARAGGGSGGAARAGAGAASPAALGQAALGQGRLGRRSGSAAVEQGQRSGRDCANGEEMSPRGCGLALKRLIPVGLIPVGQSTGPTGIS
jgi:hypothetical protein